MKPTESVRSTQSIDTLNTEEELNKLSMDLIRARTLWRHMEGDMTDFYRMAYKDGLDGGEGLCNGLLDTWFEDVFHSFYILGDYLHAADKGIEALFDAFGLERTRI